MSVSLIKSKLAGFFKLGGLLCEACLAESLFVDLLETNYSSTEDYVSFFSEVDAPSGCQID